MNFFNQIAPFFKSPTEHPWMFLFYIILFSTLAYGYHVSKNKIESKLPRYGAYLGLFIVLSVFTLGVPVLLLIILLIAHSHRPRIRRRLLKGPKVFIRDLGSAIRELSKVWGKASMKGIHIHPKIRIPKDFETKHILIVGVPGSGKTNLLYPILNDVVKRGDKTVIYDYKKDYTEVFGEDPRTLILSPFDARSVRWDVASDVQTEIEAFEFASLLCPEEQVGQKFFTRAARDLITGVIVKLQQEKNTEWNFEDLRSILENSNDIKEANKKYRPAALQNISSGGDEQAAGVFGEIRTRTANIDYLAKAWGNESNREKLSIRKWLHEATDKNLIIVQANSQFGILNNFFTHQIFRRLIKETLSFPDSRERRVWAVIDELSSLSAFPEFIDSLRLGRSKGLCFIDAVQDFGKIKKVYADEGGLESIMACFGILFAGSISCPETADYIARTFGQVEFEKRTIRRIKNNGKSERDEHIETEVTEAVPTHQWMAIKTPSLKRPAVFYFRSPGLPIIQLNYPIKPLPKRVPANILPEWMKLTSKKIKNTSLANSSAEHFEICVR